MLDTPLGWQFIIKYQSTLVTSQKNCFHSFAQLNPVKASIKQSLEGAVYERQKQDTRREVKMGMIFAVINTT